MPQNLRDEQNALRHTVDDFVEAPLHPLEAELEAELDGDPDAVRKQVIQASKECGLFTMTHRLCRRAD